MKHVGEMRCLNVTSKATCYSPMFERLPDIRLIWAASNMVIKKTHTHTHTHRPLTVLYLNTIQHILKHLKRAVLSQPLFSTGWAGEKPLGLRNPTASQGVPRHNPRNWNYALRPLNKRLTKQGTSTHGNGPQDMG
jgi:hypothetical protein